jgi:protein required for attachment to host cells
MRNTFASKTFWVVIADASRALVLSRGGADKESSIVQEFENPAARLHTSALVSDQAGRIDKNSGHVMSAMEPRTDAHEQQAIRFSHELANFLNSAAGEHEFDLLILIAPAHFLGLIRSRLNHASANQLADSQPKDLTRASLTVLESHIDQALLDLRSKAASSSRDGAKKTTLTGK